MNYGNGKLNLAVCDAVLSRSERGLSFRVRSGMVCHRSAWICDFLHSRVRNGVVEQRPVQFCTYRGCLNEV